MTAFDNDRWEAERKARLERRREPRQLYSVMPDSSMVTSGIGGQKLTVMWTVDGPVWLERKEP